MVVWEGEKTNLSSCWSYCPKGGKQRRKNWGRYSLDLFTLGMRELVVTDMGEGEKLALFKKLGKGIIIAGDRKYGTKTGMEYVREQGSDYILRLRAKAFKIYSETGEEVSIGGWLAGLGVGAVREIRAWYQAGEEYRAVRLRVVRKDAEAEQEGLRRLTKTSQRKRQGRAVSELR